MRRAVGGPARVLDGAGAPFDAVTALIRRTHRCEDHRGTEGAVDQRRPPPRRQHGARRAAPPRRQPPKRPGRLARERHRQAADPGAPRAPHQAQQLTRAAVGPTHDRAALGPPRRDRSCGAMVAARRPVPGYHPRRPAGLRCAVVVRARRLSRGTVRFARGRCHRTPDRRGGGRARRRGRCCHRRRRTVVDDRQRSHDGVLRHARARARGARPRGARAPAPCPAADGAAVASPR